MKTYIYNKVKRLALLSIVGTIFSADLHAQEELHLFEKNGKQTTFEVNEDLKVVFDKRTYIEESNYSYVNPDTIFLACSAGSTQSLGRVNSNSPWTIECASDWLMASSDLIADSLREQYGLGEYDDYFAVYALPNKADTLRSAILTIKTLDGKAKKHFTVLQWPYTLTLWTADYENGQRYDGPVCLRDTLSYLWSDTVCVVGVIPNHGVSLVDYPDWMEFDTIVAPGNTYSFEWQKKNPLELPYMETMVRFYFTPNTSRAPRHGEIVFEAGDKMTTLVVGQEGLNETTIFSDAMNLHQMLVKANYDGRDNDFGFPSLMLMMDARGMDLVSGNTDYDWFSVAKRYEDQREDYIYTYMYWYTFYNIISTTNAEIERCKAIDYYTKDYSPLVLFYLAQAHTLRAFSYFYLAQLYQQTYVGNEDQPCVPIVTYENRYDQYLTGIPRSTVKEVYEYILQDLERSIGLLDNAPVSIPKGCINKATVLAIRARVNMVMNRWEQAYDDANNVIKMGEYSPYSKAQLADTKHPFTEISHSSWIWGIRNVSDETASRNLRCWAAHMNSFMPGYPSVGAWRKISKRLFDSISSSDIRRRWFLDENGTSKNLNQSELQYVDSVSMPAYTQVKFGYLENEPGEGNFQVDVPLIRVEEMHYICAEAKAMMGDMAEALNLLVDFVFRYRDTSIRRFRPQNVDELLDEIWRQRRLEFWGEGISYFDLQRMKRPVDRRGAGIQPEYVFNIPAGDPIRIYQLPDNIFHYNPSLVQNPGYTMPQPVEDKDLQLFGTGSYTYTLCMNGTDSNMEIYRDALYPNVYVIKNWFYGVDFTFTWDGGSEVKVLDQYTGYTNEKYGKYYVVEAVDYGGDGFNTYPSYYDEETRTFYFGLVYYVDAGYFNPGYETFQLNE